MVAVHRNRIFDGGSMGQLEKEIALVDSTNKLFALGEEILSDLAIEEAIKDRIREDLKAHRHFMVVLGLDIKISESLEKKLGPPDPTPQTGGS